MTISKQQTIDLGMYMSYVLRHGAKNENIDIDKEGWINTQELIEASNKAGHSCDLSTIKNIVDTNKKKRYELSLDHLQIRALQGHSQKDVDIKFDEKIPPDFLYHGTSIDNLDKIMKEGIKKMSRLYVHLSDDIKTAESVGIRHAKAKDKLIILKIDSNQMAKDGCKFYLSSNNVWLIDFVEPKYIKK